MDIPLELFIIGITVSFGPCLLFCSPLVLPYIAATRKGFSEGLKGILTFSFARLIAYGSLGLLAGGFGRLLTEWLYRFDYLVFTVGGLFISILGVLIIFDKEPQVRLCQFLRKQNIENSTGDLLLLGFVVGILPCIPLLGVLTYIGLRATDLWQGGFYGLAFGMGKLISPLILFGVLSSVLPAVVIRNYKIYSIFRRICGGLLFAVGVQVVLSKCILW